MVGQQVELLTCPRLVVVDGGADELVFGGAHASLAVLDAGVFLLAAVLWVAPEVPGQASGTAALRRATSWSTRAHSSAVRRRSAQRSTSRSGIRRAGAVVDPSCRVRTRPPLWVSHIRNTPSSSRPASPQLPSASVAAARPRWWRAARTSSPHGGPSRRRDRPRRRRQRARTRSWRVLAVGLVRGELLAADPAHDRAGGQYGRRDPNRNPRIKSKRHRGANDLVQRQWRRVRDRERTRTTTVLWPQTERR
jgi:hypothetical protein